jgi:hypothetical protein
MLSESLVTTTWRVLRLRIEETAFATSPNEAKYLNFASFDDVAKFKYFGTTLTDQNCIN